MYNFCAFNNDKTVLGSTAAANVADEAPPDKNARNDNTSCSNSFGERRTSFLADDENDDYAAPVTKGNFSSSNDKDLVVVKRWYEGDNTDDCILEIKNYYRNMTQRLQMKQKFFDSEEKVPVTAPGQVEIPPLTLPVSPEKNLKESPSISKDCSKSTTPTLESSITTKEDTTSTINGKLSSLNDGLLDYSTLKKLLRKQRKLYKKKLEEEKTKRQALEDFLIKFNNSHNNSSADSRRSSSLNGLNATNLTSSTDCLLAKLLDEQRPTKNHHRKLWHLEKSNLQNLNPSSTLESGKIFVKRTSRQRKSSYDSSTTTSGASCCSTQITKITSNSDGFVRQKSTNSRLNSAHSLPKVIQNGTSKPFESYFLPLETENTKDRSLMEAKKNLLIEKSKRRREKITDVSRERQKLAELSRDLAANVLIGQLSLNEAARRFDALPDPPTAISRHQLFRASKKKFQMLPEIRKKREKLLQEFEVCTNRIRVKMYSQKQLSRTLSKPQSSRV